MIDQQLYALERAYGLPVVYCRMVHTGFDTVNRVDQFTRTDLTFDRVATFDARTFENLSDTADLYTSELKVTDRFFVIRYDWTTPPTKNDFIVFDRTRWNIKDYFTLDGKAAIIFQTESPETASYTLEQTITLEGVVKVS